MADIDLSTLKATELMVLQDGPPPVSLSDAGIEEIVELNVAPSAGVHLTRNLT